jgi:hypothetical protein
MKPSGIKATVESRKRLAKLTAVTKELPEAEVAVYGRWNEHRALKVRNKTFGYYCFDHHGDGMIALLCKATPGEQGRLVEEDPGRFFVPPYVGPRGWIGVRLDRRKVDWSEIAYLLRVAYRMSVPKTLAARLG